MPLSANRSSSAALVPAAWEAPAPASGQVEVAPVNARVVAGTLEHALACRADAQER